MVSALTAGATFARTRELLFGQVQHRVNLADLMRDGGHEGITADRGDLFQPTTGEPPAFGEPELDFLPRRMVEQLMPERLAVVAHWGICPGGMIVPGIVCVPSGNVRPRPPGAVPARCCSM